MTMLKRKILLTCLLVFVLFFCYGQKNFQLQSPSGAFQVSIKVADSIYYSVTADRRQVIFPSAIAMISHRSSFGVRSTLKRNTLQTVNETIVNPVPFKRKKISNHYNELTLEFRE